MKGRIATIWLAAIVLSGCGPSKAEREEAERKRAAEERSKQELAELDAISEQLARRSAESREKLYKIQMDSLQELLSIATESGDEARQKEIREEMHHLELTHAIESK